MRDRPPPVSYLPTHICRRGFFKHIFFGEHCSQLPMSPLFHPDSSVSDCSLGASWVFSLQPVLPSDYRSCFHCQDESWATRSTQSPDLDLLHCRPLLWASSASITWELI